MGRKGPRGPALRSPGSRPFPRGNAVSCLLPHIPKRPEPDVPPPPQGGSTRLQSGGASPLSRKVSGTCQGLQRTGWVPALGPCPLFSPEGPTAGVAGGGVGGSRLGAAPGARPGWWVAVPSCPRPEGVSLQVLVTGYMGTEKCQLTFAGREPPLPRGGPCLSREAQQGVSSPPSLVPAGSRAGFSHWDSFRG